MSYSPSTIMEVLAWQVSALVAGLVTVAGLGDLLLFSRLSLWLGCGVMCVCKGVGQGREEKRRGGVLAQLEVLCKLFAYFCTMRGMGKRQVAVVTKQGAAQNS